MKVFQCDMCNEIKACTQLNIGARLYDVCEPCKVGLEKKLEGKGEPTFVFKPQPDVVFVPVYPAPVFPISPIPAWPSMPYPPIVTMTKPSVGDTYWWNGDDQVTFSYTGDGPITAQNVVSLVQ